MNERTDNVSVSIIMPAYNAEKYLAQSIKSVLDQTYNNWELIVIDDGSTDATANIVKQFTAQNNKIKYIYQSNARQAAARNNGIKNAKYDIIAFLDADDLWLPNKLEKTLLHFDLEKFDLIYTNSFYGTNLELEQNTTSLQKVNKSDDLSGLNVNLQSLIGGNTIQILTVLVKKSYLLAVGLFDTNLTPAEDYDLWLRLLKNNCIFKGYNEPLSIYRVHNESSTMQDRSVVNKVIQSIQKNFTAAELKELKVEYQTKNWTKDWISLYLNKNNLDELKIMIHHFNLNTVLVRLMVNLFPMLDLNVFKRIMISKIL